jgi:hypothetical protein
MISDAPTKSVSQAKVFAGYRLLSPPASILIVTPTGIVTGVVPPSNESVIGTVPTFAKDME